MATGINSKQMEWWVWCGARKNIAPAVIEKILCNNPRHFYGL
ncbi:MAG TPA: hypothetical protein VK632_08280 [Verrucomicrobiae bacterium]|nr:hypothetical protein [Verrucomicrobiae bacterium]